MKGKHEVHAKIWISSKLTCELLWLADYIANSNGIFILNSINWPLTTANKTLYCNASGVGMGYWSPKRNMGFHYRIPNRDQNDKSKQIFYFEAYTVVSAFHWVTHSQPPPQHIIVFTDSKNTVDIFDSFRALGIYNPFLTTVIDLII
jgi:hypothetical protein